MLVLLLALACHRDPGTTDTETDTDLGTDTDTDTEVTAASGPSIDELVGLNGFIDDPTERLVAFGNLREYHQWSWNDQESSAYPNNTLQFSLWSGFWDFDAYYTALHEAGVQVFPCLQGSVASLGWAMPPAPSGADTTDALSYAAHADYVFQVVARYGSVAVPDGQLKLADGQARVSGLGVARDFEDGNEPDDNWSTGDGSYLFEPEEYAAMASADYDGHRGALGPGHGLKAADPDARLVMAGLAGAGPDDWITNVTNYLDRMRAWADAHREGEFPADVLNVHYYCMGPSSFDDPDPEPALSPEDCALAERLAPLDEWRDQHLPNHPLWLTEFGYDTDAKSRLRAPAIGAKPAEQVQAEWLVRSLLAIAEAGFDRANVFVSRDNCSTSACAEISVQFSTSGVLKEKGDFTPKTAFWYLATFRSALAGTRYDGRAPSHGDDVHVAQFRGEDGSGAYVVWLPTAEDRRQEGHALPVPGATTARAVRLVDGSAEGEIISLSITDGAVVLDVDEAPVIVLVDRVP